MKKLQALVLVGVGVAIGGTFPSSKATTGEGRAFQLSDPADCAAFDAFAQQLADKAGYSAAASILAVPSEGDSAWCWQVEVTSK